MSTEGDERVGGCGGGLNPAPRALEYAWLATALGSVAGAARRETQQHIARELDPGPTGCSEDLGS